MFSDELKDRVVEIVKELQTLAKENDCSISLDVSKHGFIPKAHILTTHEDKTADTTYEEEIENDILFTYSRVGSGKRV